MDRKIIFAITVSLVLLMSDCLLAASIWAKRDSNVGKLYADDVARSIGDVLTIEIIEESTVDNKAKRDLQKETARSSNFSGDLNIDHILIGMPLRARYSFASRIL